MDKKVFIGIICVIAIICIVAIAAFGGGDSTPETSINVTDLAVSSQGYGMYDLTCNLVPDKDYDYLEAVVVFYDDSGAVVGKSPLAWNMNDITKDQHIKVSGTAVVSGDNTPTRAEVYFFDSAFSGDDMSSAIYNQTVDL